MLPAFRAILYELQRTYSKKFLSEPETRRRKDGTKGHRNERTMERKKGRKKGKKCKDLTCIYLFILKQKGPKGHLHCSEVTYKYVIGLQ